MYVVCYFGMVLLFRFIELLMDYFPIPLICWLAMFGSNIWDKFSVTRTLDYANC